MAETPTPKSPPDTVLQEQNKNKLLDAFRAWWEKSKKSQGSLQPGGIKYVEITCNSTIPLSANIAKAIVTPAASATIQDKTTGGKFSSASGNLIEQAGRINAASNEIFALAGIGVSPDERFTNCAALAASFKLTSDGKLTIKTDKGELELKWNLSEGKLKDKDGNELSFKVENGEYKVVIKKKTPIGQTEEIYTLAADAAFDGTSAAPTFEVTDPTTGRLKIGVKTIIDFVEDDNTARTTFSDGETLLIFKGNPVGWWFDAAGRPYKVAASIDTPLDSDQPIGGLPSESAQIKSLFRQELLGQIIGALPVDDDPGHAAAAPTLAAIASAGLIDPQVLATKLWSSSDWLEETLAYIGDTAGDYFSAKLADKAAASLATVEFYRDLLVYFSGDIDRLGLGDPTFRSEAMAGLVDFVKSSLGPAIANLNGDLLQPRNVALAGVLGDTQLDFVDYRPIRDALEAAAIDSRYAAIAGLIKLALGDALDASQAVEIRAAAGANDPFADRSLDPNQPSSTVAQVAEGRVRVFDLQLANVAGLGGQKIRLQLEGAGAGVLKVLWNGVELTPLDGAVEVEIAAGLRRTTIVLAPGGDIDTDLPVELRATLLDASGAPTHQTHLELNLTLDGNDEASQRFDLEIAGDRLPVDFDPAAPGIQTRTDELGNVIVGPEVDPIGPTPCSTAQATIRSRQRAATTSSEPRAAAMTCWTAVPATIRSWPAAATMW